MKVHSFTKFDMINLSKAVFLGLLYMKNTNNKKTLAMTSAQCVMYVYVSGTCITVLECFSFSSLILFADEHVHLLLSSMRSGTDDCHHFNWRYRWIT